MVVTPLYPTGCERPQKIRMSVWCQKKGTQLTVLASIDYFRSIYFSTLNFLFCYFTFLYSVTVYIFAFLYILSLKPSNNLYVFYINIFLFLETELIMSFMQEFLAQAKFLEDGGHAPCTVSVS